MPVAPDPARTIPVTATSPQVTPEVLIPSAHPAPPAGLDGLDAVVRRHLDAITARDLDAYAATLGEHITLVLPGGRVCSGRDRVLDAVGQMFTTPRWTQDFTELRRSVTGGTAFVLFDSVYREHDEAGAETGRARLLLGLTLTATPDGWLVHADHSTPLPELR
ncbi:MAG TPA: nuclear transport factor 2 family protein [Pseudonocardiaceae bacterium]